MVCLRPTISGRMTGSISLRSPIIARDSSEARQSIDREVRVIRRREVLLDHLVRTHNDRLRDFDIQRLRSFEIDGQLELGRLFDRKIARFGPFYDR